MTTPTLADIREAAERIRPYAHRTPVVTCTSLDQRLGVHLFLSVKTCKQWGPLILRGVCNAVFSLSAAEAARGVATHSSGNHAQALALSAQLRGIPAYIVMPSNAPAVKKAAAAGYGCDMTYCEPTLAAREATVAQLVAATGATVIHPYNNRAVITGQGTATLELLEDVPDLDVMVLVGGGGLLSGTGYCRH